MTQHSAQVNHIMKTPSAFTIILTLLLAACSPAARAQPTPAPSISVATPTKVSAIPATISSVTVIVGTAVPGIVSSPLANVTPLPIPTAAPPTPISTLPSGASPTELKYQVLSQFPNLFFCDPDYYPVARADEADLARQRFPELQANPEEFQAILNHTGLSGLTAFTDEQKLLVYREHKKLAAIHFTPAGDRYQFQLQIADGNEQGFFITGLIDSSGSITIQQREPSIATCPICLAGQTRIDTPQGPVAVEDLRVGDAIWTVDARAARAARVSATILKTARVIVPVDHPMMHVVLDDGRELWASPGHPTIDGRTLGDLKLGDRLDGGRVMRLERVSYDQSATYDVLPSGETGFYWADGILLGSTLANP